MNKKLKKIKLSGKNFNGIPLFNMEGHGVLF